MVDSIDSTGIAFVRPAERAARYRDRADHLREMADDEPNERLRQSLLGMADEYEDLAKTISAGVFSIVKKPADAAGVKKPTDTPVSRLDRLVERVRVWRVSRDDGVK